MPLPGGGADGFVGAERPRADVVRAAVSQDEVRPGVDTEVETSRLERGKSEVPVGAEESEAFLCHCHGLPVQVSGQAPSLLHRRPSSTKCCGKHSKPVPGGQADGAGIVTHIMNYPYPEPEPVTLEGRWCRLEPLDEQRHFSGLLEAVTSPGEADRFRYLLEEPPDAAALRRWLRTATAPEGDRLFHAVTDRTTGRCGGRQALMRIEPRHGVLEI